jgi:hypothetical protein
MQIVQNDAYVCKNWGIMKNGAQIYIFDPDLVWQIR